MRLSIRRKLILSISIPLLITYTFMLGWDYYRGRSDEISERETMVSESAQTLANGCNARLESIMQSAETIATAVTRQWRMLEMQQIRETRERREDLFANLRPNFLVNQVVIVQPGTAADPDVLTIGRGRGPFGVRNSTNLSKLAGANDEYAQVKNAGKALWLKPHADASTSQTVCTYAVPLMNGNLVHGAVLMEVSVSDLFNRNRGRPREPGTRPATREGIEPAGANSPPPEPNGATPGPPQEPTSSLSGPPPIPPSDEPGNPTVLTSYTNTQALLDHDGWPLATGGGGQPRQTALKWAEEHHLAEFAAAFHQAQGGESSIARVPPVADMPPGFIAGETYWIALAPISATGWVFAAAVPESKVIGSMMQRLQQRALFLAGGLLIILIVAALVSIRLSRPIEHMASAVNQLAAGNLDARVTGVKSHDELGQLARAFNVMTGQLKAHVRALTAQTAAQEKVESELRIARQIQNDLLPRTFPPFPDRPEFDLHAVNVPAAGVAGDFYDFFFADDQWLTICIADVSGKGVPAALLMAVTRTIVRNLCFAGLSPSKIAARANEMLLADSSNNMFVTMFLCQYNTRDGRIRYVNAGHPQPFRLATRTPSPCTQGEGRGEGSSSSNSLATSKASPHPNPLAAIPGEGTSAITLFGSVTAPLIGVCSAEEIGPFNEAEDQLAPGETLFLYTDGVTEARASDGSMLRDEGTRKLLAKHDAEDVATFCGSMVQEIESYQDHHPADDITIVALRRKA